MTSSTTESESLDCFEPSNDSSWSTGNFTNSTELIDDYEEQRQAVMYIVVVLLFYSTSIITLMVKYMRKEREQWAEDEMYRNFLAKARLIAMQESKYQWSRTISLQLQRSGWANNSISSVNSGSTVNAGDNSMPTINQPDSGRSSFSTSISVSPALLQNVSANEKTALLSPPPNSSRNRSASSSNVMMNPMDSSASSSTSMYLTQPKKDERSRSLPIQGHEEILHNSALLLPSSGGKSSRKTSATSVTFAVDFEGSAKRSKVSIV